MTEREVRRIKLAIWMECPKVRARVNQKHTEWREANRDRMNERRREKYATDAESRANKLRNNHQSRQRNAK